MRITGIVMALFLYSTLTWGLDLEVGVPVRSLDGARITVMRLVEGDCWILLAGGLCIQRGGLLANAEIKDSENVQFLGGNIFARFNGGDFWSRIGFGWGVFSRKVEEKIRSRWDFNISIQYGAMVLPRLGLTIGWDHWSNGRSFAKKLGLEDVWPDFNDGGDTLLAGVIWRW